MSKLQTYWWPIPKTQTPVALPPQFPFPFHYDPHPLAQQAAQLLQMYLQTRSDLTTTLEASKVGKMFGVLVVSNQAGKLGFLAAFSGKIGEQSTIPPFVPPFYDRHDPKGFFRLGEEELNQINQRIETFLKSEAYLHAEQKKVALEQQAKHEITALKDANRKAKQLRDQQRSAARSTRGTEAYQALEEILRKQSIRRHFLLKDLKKKWKQRLAEEEAEWQTFIAELKMLKTSRKEKSASLQRQLFARYDFLNALGERKNVQEIFASTVFKVPPAGAGDCAAPKLLQFAFQHQLVPIAMAEFWWGRSPKSAIRKHGHFYPACRGKCEPILGHMLLGMEVEANPLEKNRVQITELEIVFEDQYFLAINKPAGFLSVPGKTWTDSVQLRMQQQYPAATGPLIVHRLDMSTSGLMLIAKQKEIHKAFQHKFLKRTIKKRYLALLQGTLLKDEGTIDLPLRVDMEDRPRQLGCVEYGKAARTHYQVVERKDGCTRIHFFPITGRTHQLRVHAAHPMGLNLPIVGDELYGTPADRLYLHAEEVSFRHPVSGKAMTIRCPASF